MGKRIYSNEFKQEAVRLSYQRENIKELAYELGIQVQWIYKWRSAFRESEAGISPIRALKQDERAELKQLTAVIKQLFFQSNRTYGSPRIAAAMKRQGWLYLTTIIDLFDRQVIGWALSKILHTKEIVIPAWKMALSKRTISKPLIFHSDRGVQYASNLFRNDMKQNCLIIQSMSRKGNCWDNAVAESFFKTLKTELIYHKNYKTIEQAKSAVFEYIEVWYNRKRLHSVLGYKTPVEIELEYTKFNNVA